MVAEGMLTAPCGVIMVFRPGLRLIDIGTFTVIVCMVTPPCRKLLAAAA
jgi:hypothetical protein